VKKENNRGKDEGKHEQIIKQIVFLFSLCMCMWKEEQGKKRKHLGRIRSLANRHVSHQLFFVVKFTFSLISFFFSPTRSRLLVE
jgi:hypothetical protein